MSTKKSLIDVRSNTCYRVDYTTLMLSPSIELILLTTEPEYKVVKRKGTEYVEQGRVLREFRVTTSLAGINSMIGKLQQHAAELQTMEQMSEGLNVLITASKKKDPATAPQPEEKP